MVKKLNTADMVMVLGLEDENVQLTHRELERILYDTVQLSVSDSIMTRIFNECDADGSGKVSVQELVDYINAIHLPGVYEKYMHVLKQCVLSFVWWMTVMFFVVVTTNVSLNIRRRGLGVKSDFNYSRFLGILFTFACCSFALLLYRDVESEIQMIERTKKKILDWVKRVDGSVGDTTKDMTASELSEVLQKDGTYLPVLTFETVFAKIDKDNSGTLNFEEVKEYALKYEKRGELSSVQIALEATKACIKLPMFHISLFWIWACILLTIPPFCDACSPNAVKHMYGFAGILFQISIMASLYLIIQDHQRALAYARDLTQIFLAMVVDTYQSHFEEGGGDVDSKKMTKEDMLNAIKAEDARAVDACNQTFLKLDSSSGGSLDFVEVYDGLTKAGVVVRIEVLKSLFHEIDEDMSGEIDMDEFVEFLLNIEMEKTDWEKFVEAVKAASKTTNFWFTMLQLLLNPGYIIGDYAPISPEAVQNWYLVATLSWLFPAWYSLYNSFATPSSYFEAYSRSKVNFRRALFSAVSKQKNKDKVDLWSASTSARTMQLHSSTNYMTDSSSEVDC